MSNSCKNVKALSPHQPCSPRRCRLSSRLVAFVPTTGNLHTIPSSSDQVPSLARVLLSAKERQYKDLLLLKWTFHAANPPRMMNKWKPYGMSFNPTKKSYSAPIIHHPALQLLLPLLPLLLLLIPMCLGPFTRYISNRLDRQNNLMMSAAVCMDSPITRLPLGICPGKLVQRNQIAMAEAETSAT